LSVIFSIICLLVRSFIPSAILRISSPRSRQCRGLSYNDENGTGWRRINDHWPGDMVGSSSTVRSNPKSGHARAASAASYDLNWSRSTRCGRDIECIRTEVTRPGSRARHVCRLGLCLREDYDCRVAVPVVIIGPAPAPTPPVAKYILISQEAISQKVIIEATMKMASA